RNVKAAVRHTTADRVGRSTVGRVERELLHGGDRYTGVAIDVLLGELVHLNRKIARLDDVQLVLVVGRALVHQPVGEVLDLTRVGTGASDGDQAHAFVDVRRRQLVP